MLSDRRVHTTLPSADLDRLRRFYEDTLGLVPKAVRPGVIVYQVAETTQFVISRSSGKPSGTHTQMAFTVTDIEADVAELKARGVIFESYEMPKTVDGIAPMPAGRAAWFRDPDGNLIGLIEYAEPV